MVYLSFNEPCPWLFEAHCLSVVQSLSDYWASATAPGFLATNLRLVDLITAPTETQWRQPKAALFGLSVGTNAGSCKPLDTELFVFVFFSAQIQV